MSFRRSGIAVAATIASAAAHRHRRSQTLAYHER
jgi:hypothetical protein